MMISIGDNDEPDDAMMMSLGDDAPQ